MLSDAYCYNYVGVSFTVDTYSICVVCIKSKKKKA